MSVEDRKKERYKKVLDVILDSNPVTGISKRVSEKAFSLLKGKLTEEKEMTLDSILKDLKSEEKLSKGDRGAAETIPKKNFDKSVFMSKFKKGMRNATPAKLRASSDKKFKGHTGRG